MSEIITEMILPGTYIEVRPEGLLSVGAIATGNVGIIGTAEKGSNRVETLSNFEEARARFGDMGTWDASDPESNLSLVRAIKLLFDNGASTIYAQRVFAESSAKPAKLELASDTGAPVLTLEANSPGEWGNRLQVRIEPAETAEVVSNEKVTRNNGTFAVSAKEVFIPANGNGSRPSLGTVTVRDNGLARRYQIHTEGSATAQAVSFNQTNRTFSFASTLAPTAEVRASYRVPQPSLRRVTLRFGNFQEVYTVPSLSYLEQLLSDEANPSKLVRVVPGRNSDGLPNVSEGFQPFSGGENGAVTSDLFQTALDNIVERNIQILIVPRPFAEVKSAILGHVEKTENLGHERIAVVGADSNDPEKVLENANDVADKRVVLVAPGLKQRDPATGRMIDLPAFYTAAAIAGKLSSLAPHISLTNKALAGIDALGAEYNSGDLKALVLNRVLTLHRKRGTRVVKGISTDEAAFKQITTRRIVDYAKTGIRDGANQYIGLLNNRRVRENLRTTLDAFLADLVLREFLTGYKLAVFADRAMEIRGEVLVTIDLMPTFSIDYVRVIMNLM
jgi:hypothetical protein